MNKYVVWNKCNGEAHSNPWIDHCMVCLPYWENYPTCPDCNHKVYLLPSHRYRCKNCKTILYDKDQFTEIAREYDNDGKEIKRG